MNEIAEQIIKQLIEYNKHKLHLMEELLDISKKQEVSLTSGSYNSLLDQIKFKQDIMDQIDLTDRAFYQDFLQLKSVLNINTMDEIKKEDFPNIIYLRSLVAEILDKLSSINEMDKKNNNGVKDEIEKIKGEMKSLSHHSKASKVYSNNYNVEAPGFFVDSKK